MTNSMRITFVKGKKVDRIQVSRADGSEVSTEFSHKGPAPHDAVHFFVEQELGLTQGFWGLVAAGHHPDALAEMARLAGHPSAKRGVVPAPEFVQAIQAERIVEAFEADQWSGGTDPAGVRDMATSGCWQSRVDRPTMSDNAITTIRRDLAAFTREWSDLPLGGSRSLSWEAPEASA